jgi:hypothetical protein
VGLTVADAVLFDVVKLVAALAVLGLLAYALSLAFDRR